MDIGFSSNHAQKASHLRSHSHKSRGEFGIREIRYVSYRIAVVRRIAIGFLSNRVQEALYLRSHLHKSRAIRLLASNG